MSDPESDRKRDIICGCSGTTRAQIRKLVDRGVTDLEGISQASGVCSGCGGCDSDVLAYLNACLAERASSQSQPLSDRDHRP